MAAQSGTGSPPGEGCCVELGWLDLPRRQQAHPALVAALPADGHLALVGGTAGDAARAMSLALHQLAAHPEESHLYVLDADGSLSGMKASARTGAVVGLHELRRGVRVLERLAPGDVPAAERCRSGPGHSPGPGGLRLGILGLRLAGLPLAMG